MKEKLNIEVKIELIYSKEDDSYEVLNTFTNILSRFPVKENDWIDKEFTKSEIQYGYIGFNSKKDYIGDKLIPGQDIKVALIKGNDVNYFELKVHSKARRIDRLTQIYSYEKIKEGDKVNVRYIDDKNLLEIKLY